ncbi:MAG: peptidoglycan-associated lipoprotein Pal [Pseudomonadota bacterium]|nr:peptidoglycan-associated lipoprotein Pal [Pseudomonadota bacterium]
MNLFVKSMAVLSAVFLLAACETSPSSMSGKQGGGAAGGPVTPGSEQDLAQNVGDRVFFDTDKSDLSADAQQTLGRQAAWLKQYANVNVTVEGHCDERGTREYNLALGERRAAAAKKYLVGLGIPASRISTISYGKERPAVIGNDESAWSQNRRAVTVVTNP